VNCSIIRSSGIKGTIKAAAFLLRLKLTNIWPILKRKKEKICLARRERPVSRLLQKKLNFNVGTRPNI